MTTIGLAVPTIPPRTEQLRRALTSVVAGQRLPDRISIVTDHGHNGAATTRNAAWRALGDVDYVAFLDDDDEWLPNHLRVLMFAALETKADLLYSYFTIPEGLPDPLALNGKPVLGHPFDDEAREEILASSNFIPITVLVRREALEAIDGFPSPNSERWPHPTNEDWCAWRDLLNAGYTFHHVPERTWLWHHWGYGMPGVPGNVSGDPRRW